MNITKILFQWSFFVLIFIGSNDLLAQPNVECIRFSESTDETREIQLISASALGDLHKVDALVKVGVSPNASDEDLMTPLAWASFCGHFEIVKYLVASGADINFKFSFTKGAFYINKNSTAIIWAVDGGQKEIVEYLLSKGANPIIREKIYSKEGGAEKFISDGRNAYDVEGANGFTLGVIGK